MSDSIHAGDTCTVIHDVVINTIVAFRKGERVVVEAIDPNLQRPDYKFVVFSESLQMRYQLSEADLAQAMGHAQGNLS